MASRRSAGENGARDGVDATGDAFRVLAQGLAQLQDALRLQRQEAERNVQEILRLQQQEAERKVQEALLLQDERTATALGEMERKLREKDDAILTLQQRLQGTLERVTAVEERTTASEGSGGEGDLQRLEGRVEKVEVSLQSALQTFFPRVEAVLRQLEQPHSTRASLATAASPSVASARETPATGGAAAGSGEEPPPPEAFPAPFSSSSTPTSSDDDHQGAATDEEERERQQVELRVREAQLRKQEALMSPSLAGEQLCEAAKEGILTDVRRFIDSGANVDYTDGDGFTPLHHASSCAHSRVVSLLLQRGADTNVVCCSGYTALHYAALSASSGWCVDLLVGAGAQVNARNEDGVTPLHEAVFSDNERAVRALLGAGARRDLKPWKGAWKNKTPFDLAMLPVVQDLLRL